MPPRATSTLISGAPSSAAITMTDSAIAEMRTAKIFRAAVGEERIRSRSERA